MGDPLVARLLVDKHWGALTAAAERAQGRVICVQTAKMRKQRIKQLQCPLGLAQHSSAHSGGGWLYPTAFFSLSKLYHWYRHEPSSEVITRSSMEVKGNH